MKKLFWGLLCAVPTLLFSQGRLADDFSGAVGGGSVPWLGDTALFAVTPDSLLQLQAPPAAGEAWLYLSAPTRLGDSCVWELLVRLDFAPSDYNRFVFWLAGDEADPASGRGYFLKIGETGSQDALRLYRQDGPGQTVLLASGTAGAVANVPRVRVRVTRDPAGNWQLWADHAGGFAFQSEGPTVRDTVWAQSFFTGLWCRFTASNSRKFFFDDFSVGPIRPDTVPPALVAAEVLSDTVALLTFDEPLAVSGIGYLGNYALFPYQPIASSASVPDRPDRVRVVFSVGLSPDTAYALRIEGLRDPAGNEMEEQWGQLRYVPPVVAVRHDLIFTELYPDPSPSFGLPGHEFVELYNRSALPLPLGGLRLADAGGTEAVLPPDTLAPGAWVLLCGEQAAPAYAAFGKTIGLAGFPVLNDDSDTLLLYGLDGTLLDAVGYDRNTYGDPAKSSGGWTLTRLDWGNPCLLGRNWGASEAVWLGGTPGAGQSRTSPAALEPFRAVRWRPIGDSRLCVWFSRSVDPIMGSSPGHFSLTGGPSLVGARVLPPLGERVELTLDAPLEAGRWYGLHLDPALADCSGALLGAADSFRVALPLAPMPGEVLVNELLFDPLPYGSDFVELFNASSKLIDLGSLVLADADGQGFPLEKFRLPSGNWLYPGAYCAISPDTAFLSAQYPCADAGGLVLGELPEMLDDSGRVLLLGLSDAGEGYLLESVRYSAGGHSGLLADVEGVSLERRDPGRPSDAPQQWVSASDACRGATPGRSNTALAAVVRDSVPDDWIELGGAAFTPDGDGWDDRLPLLYNVSATAGAAVDIRVYDARGCWVAEVCRGQFVQGAGELYWDGARADGSPASPGPYVLRAEAVVGDGQVWRKKLVAVLAGK